MTGSGLRLRAPMKQRNSPGGARGLIGRYRELAGKYRELALLPAIVLLVIIGVATTQGEFFTGSNFISLGQESAALAVITVGEVIVMLAGLMDLSLQSTYGLAPTIGAWLCTSAVHGGSGLMVNPFLAMLIIPVLGILIGVINGILVAYVRLNAFIITLAMLILLAGVQLGIPNGQTIFDLPGPMLWFGAAKWFGLPVIIIMSLMVYVLLGGVLRYTYFGRSIYAVGGRRMAARAAGINDKRVLLSVFALAGCIAAFGGLLLTSSLTAVSPGQGNNVIFSVFAAAVIGGVSLNGGKGRLIGALIGVVVLTMISNILTLVGFQAFWIDAASGLIIVIALLVARFSSGVADIGSE
jgi:simple sugar transport system permease protein